MTPTLTVAQAVEILKEAADDHADCFAFNDNPEIQKIRAALAALAEARELIRDWLKYPTNATSWDRARAWLSKYAARMKEAEHE